MMDLTRMSDSSTNDELVADGSTPHEKILISENASKTTSLPVAPAAASHPTTITLFQVKQRHDGNDDGVADDPTTAAHQVGAGAVVADGSTPHEKILISENASKTTSLPVAPAAAPHPTTITLFQVKQRHDGNDNGVADDPTTAAHQVGAGAVVAAAERLLPKPVVTKTKGELIKQLQLKMLDGGRQTPNLPYLHGDESKNGVVPAAAASASVEAVKAVASSAQFQNSADSRDGASADDTKTKSAAPSDYKESQNSVVKTEAPECSLSSSSSTTRNVMSVVQGFERRSVVKNVSSDDICPQSPTDGTGTTTKWIIGDMLWARVSGHPWWPCMVAYDPTHTSFTRTLKRRQNAMVQYHVQFFGDEGERGWINESSIVPFEGRAAFERFCGEMIALNRRDRLNYVVPARRAKAWNVAVDYAEEAFPMTRVFRVHRFAFVYDKPATTTMNGAVLIESSATVVATADDVATRPAAKRARSGSTGGVADDGGLPKKRQKPSAAEGSSPASSASNAPSAASDRTEGGCSSTSNDAVSPGFSFLVFGSKTDGVKRSSRSVKPTNKIMEHLEDVSQRKRMKLRPHRKIDYVVVDDANEAPSFFDRPLDFSENPTAYSDRPVDFSDKYLVVARRPAELYRRLAESNESAYRTEQNHQMACSSGRNHQIACSSDHNHQMAYSTEQNHQMACSSDRNHQIACSSDHNHWLAFSSDHNHQMACSSDHNHQMAYSTEQNHQMAFSSDQNHQMADDRNKFANTANQMANRMQVTSNDNQRVGAGFDSTAPADPLETMKMEMPASVTKHEEVNDLSVSSTSVVKRELVWELSDPPDMSLSDFIGSLSTVFPLIPPSPAAALPTRPSLPVVPPSPVAPGLPALAAPGGPRRQMRAPVGRAPETTELEKFLKASPLTPVASGKLTPVLSGITTPVASGIMTPVASRKLTPVLSGITTPVASGITTPVVSRKLTPGASGQMTSMCVAKAPVVLGQATHVAPRRITVVPGRMTPVMSGTMMPFLTGKVTPVMSRRGRPRLSDKATPALPGKMTPVMSRGGRVVSGKTTPIVSEGMSPVVSLSMMRWASSGKLTPVLPGNVTPLTSRNATPGASENVTPVASGNMTPVLFDEVTPVASGNVTPVASSGNATPVSFDKMTLALSSKARRVVSAKATRDAPASGFRKEKKTPTMRKKTVVDKKEQERESKTEGIENSPCFVARSNAEDISVSGRDGPVPCGANSCAESSSSSLAFGFRRGGDRERHDDRESLSLVSDSEDGILSVAATTTESGDGVERQPEFRRLLAAPAPLKNVGVCHICEKSGDVLIDCQGPCFGSYHLSCLGLIVSPVGSFRCDECSTGNHPCFVCKRTSRDTVACSVPRCGRFYHRECISRHALCRSDGAASLTCPFHTCTTCAAAAETGRNGRATKGATTGAMYRCIRCPTAYHANDFCVAAGTIEIAGHHVVCNRHSAAVSAKSSRLKTAALHVNADWCFVCSKDSVQMSCSACPAAFHAACTKTTTPNDPWTCRDCVVGRRPVYGEVIWAKIGSYRWWPAEVCYSRYLPQHVLDRPHDPFSFAVRLFGNGFYFWTQIGRVFPLHEGDRLSREQASYRTVAQVFERAVFEATEVYRLRSAASRETKTTSERDRNDHKPAPYKHVKTNIPLGDVEIYKAIPSEVPSCHCGPDQDDPCGPDSDCINRLMMYECNVLHCPAGERCRNQRLQKRDDADARPYRTDVRGWGLRSRSDIKKGRFIAEYVGDLVDPDECNRRLEEAQRNNVTNFYMLTLDKKRIIDAGPKGNYTRFMNHSCEPNCETQKWTVNGDIRVGLFAVTDITTGSELTFNYNLDCYGNQKTVCKCGSSICSGFLGVRPKTAAAANVERKSHEAKLKKQLKEINVKVKDRKDTCFSCKRRGEVVACQRPNCTKSYHLRCVDIGLASRPTAEGRFVCPRHSCAECGSAAAATLCSVCPRSFCLVHATASNVSTVADGNLVCRRHNNIVESSSRLQDDDDNAAPERPAVDPGKGEGADPVDAPKKRGGGRRYKKVANGAPATVATQDAVAKKTIRDYRLKRNVVVVGASNATPDCDVPVNLSVRRRPTTTVDDVFAGASRDANPRAMMRRDARTDDDGGVEGRRRRGSMTDLEESLTETTAPTTEGVSSM